MSLLIDRRQGRSTEPGENRNGNKSIHIDLIVNVWIFSENGGMFVSSVATTKLQYSEALIDFTPKDNFFFI